MRYWRDRPGFGAAALPDVVGASPVQDLLRGPATEDGEKSTAVDPAARAHAERLAAIVDAVEDALPGKRRAVELALIALVTGGHVLIEDPPGTGKTTLARLLAHCVSGEFSRIQFTPDLLPGDITGSSVWDPRNLTFHFTRGPVFANVVLADEINRAPARSQAALLEAMEERQVTVDGVSHPLSPPFCVIATQNPEDSAGTYPLPEAQLDRFMIRLGLGHPDRDAGRKALTVDTDPARWLSPAPVVEQLDLADPLTSEELVGLAGAVADVHVAPDLQDYVLALVEGTRHHPDVRQGASLRGALALHRAARGRALLRGRAYVLPDDVKDLAAEVLAHRLVLDAVDPTDRAAQLAVVDQLLADVPLPPAPR